MAFSPDCPYHRPVEVVSVGATTITRPVTSGTDDVVIVGDVAFTRAELDGMPWSHVLPWRPTDSDS